MTTNNIAETYNQFQNDFGSSVEQDYDALIESLFSPEFTKTANGQVLVASRDALLKQLSDLKITAGGWTIDSKHIIVPAEDHNYAIRYFIHTETIGSFDVMLLLGSSDGIKIDFVDEVYYQI